MNQVNQSSVMKKYFLISLLIALMSMNLEAENIFAGNPDLFLPAIPSPVEWNICWENGEKTTACSDADGRLVMHALAPA